MSIGTAQVSFKNWAGQTTPGGLGVIRLVRRTPVVWLTRCAACGSETTIPHSRIEYAECKSAVCGQPVRKRTRDEEERERRVERERRALAEENRLAELRMEAETADYAMPANRPPVAGNDGPMTERQRLERRAWQEELEAEEHERQRPVREAEAQLQQTHRQLQAAQRERLVNPELEDVDLFISPEVAGASMPQSHAKEHNILEWQKFGNAHPEFYPTDHNLSLLIDYHIRNHAEIYTAGMLERVYLRMKDAGVEFDEKPAPEPEPDVMRYDKREPVEVRISAPAEPPTYRGFDLENGEPRVYTEREVNKMSSEQMKKALQMTTRGELELPRVGPGPKGSKG